MEVKFTFWMQRNPRTLLLLLNRHIWSALTHSIHMIVILRSYFQAAYQLILKGVRLSKRMFYGRRRWIYFVNNESICCVSVWAEETEGSRGREQTEAGLHPHIVSQLFAHYRCWCHYHTGGCMAIILLCIIHLFQFKALHNAAALWRKSLSFRS